MQPWPHLLSSIACAVSKTSCLLGASRPCHCNTEAKSDDLCPNDSISLALCRSSHIVFAFFQVTIEIPKGLEVLVVERRDKKEYCNFVRSRNVEKMGSERSARKLLPLSVSHAPCSFQLLGTHPAPVIIFQSSRMSLSLYSSTIS